jgi:hypothetical protein
VHDYVAFYFGVLSPMLLQLKTGQVPGYGEGQEPLIYLMCSVQAVVAAGLPFVLTDGHSLARWTQFFEEVARLDQVDWDVVGRRYWADTIDDPDRQRRTQAEFLVHRFLPWGLPTEIGVRSDAMKAEVEAILAGRADVERKMVVRRPGWYY